MTDPTPDPGEPEVLVIQPDPSGGLDRFAGWLDAEGVRVRTVRPFAGETVPGEFAADGLIVLGGAMGARDVDQHPWLADIAQLFRHSIDAAVPTLGICLGAQLLAHALDGEVQRGARGPEIGLTRIDWMDSAQDDALFSGLPAPFHAASFHFDEIVRLPSGAVHLGASDLYRHQAFRIASAWGVQFHPEVSPESFRTWRDEVVETAPAFAGRYSRLADELARADEEVAAGTRSLVHRFSRILRAAMRGGAGATLPAAAPAAVISPRGR